mmetsp:Transcript_40097/g.55716  ORF Transcript_40097/g.55716 Transcript_40097/m.55716 type:complete len:114 (+) Transcript_40097:147-488(+)
MQTQEEIERRRKFLAFFGGVSADTHGQANTSHEEFLDRAHSDFKNMPARSPKLDSDEPKKHQPIQRARSSDIDVSVRDSQPESPKAVERQMSASYSLHREHFINLFDTIDLKK